MCIRDRRTTVQLDTEAEKLVTDIQQAAWNNTPELKRASPGFNNPMEIRDLVSKKREACKKCQLTGASEDKSILNHRSQ